MPGLVLVFSVDWHPGGRRIASTGSAGRQNAVKVWDSSEGREYFENPVGQAPAVGEEMFADERPVLGLGLIHAAEGRARLRLVHSLFSG